MKQHKWHKEIKAWADGAEIEFYDPIAKSWDYIEEPIWWDNTEYRIKPQELINGLTEEETNNTMSVKGLSKPKEPKYLYAFWNGMIRRIDFATEYDGNNEMCKYIGKIKIEVDDEDN